MLQLKEKAHNSALCELLQVSMVTLLSTNNVDSISKEDSSSKDDDLKKIEFHHFGLIQITLSKTKLTICPRCRRYTSSDGNLCFSCLKVCSL